MKRPLMDRIQDRLWREAGRRLALQPESSIMASEGGSDASVSGNMPWTIVCSALADGRLDSRHFRRLRAVRQVVETVGPSDARFYAQKIREWGKEWLDHPAVAAFDDWGSPFRCPRLLLGTSRPFSPTTLRYLASALWLQRSGKLTPESNIVEIGVGFGGLAAMNGVVSKSRTVLVDLPQVEKAALRMLKETGMAGYAASRPADGTVSIPLAISNYAFTELSTGLQDEYIERYLKHTAHGMILSNAGVFASAIGGRTDEQLVIRLREAGRNATLDGGNELLSPTDRLCGVRLIHW